MIRKIVYTHIFVFYQIHILAFVALMKNEDMQLSIKLFFFYNFILALFYAFTSCLNYPHNSLYSSKKMLVRKF